VRTDASGWLEAAVAELDESWLTTVVDSGIDEVLGQIAEVSGDHAVQAGILEMGYEAMRSLAPALGTAWWSDPEVPRAGMECARLFAQRGLPPTVLMKSYRVGQTHLWRVAMRSAKSEIADPELRLQVLELAWERLHRWIEFVLPRLSDVYEAERDHWIRGDLARRAEMITAILTGATITPDHASRILNHPMRGAQTALVLWAGLDVTESRAMVGLQALAARIAGAVNADGPLIHSTSSRELWVWLRTGIRQHVDNLTPAVDPHGNDMWVAIGRGGEGIDGFRSSHTEARAAQRVVVDAHKPERVTFYDDVEIVSLLSRDRVAMRALMQHELGGLASPDNRGQRLRETALAYLSCERNITAAAKQLQTHRNTVAYRLRQIDELLPAPISGHRHHLELALMLADTFGVQLIAQPGTRR